MKIKFETRNYDFVKEVIESYEMEDVLNDFKETFKEGEDISYKDYYDFCYKWIDDVSETYYINCNWNDEFDEI